MNDADYNQRVVLATRALTAAAQEANLHGGDLALRLVIVECATAIVTAILALRV